MRIQPFGSHTLWRLGNVLRAVDARSYEVQLQSGGVLRRNRKHLRRAHGQTLSESMDMETVVVLPQTVPETHTDTDTGDTHPPGSNVLPVTTRAGRTVVTPQRYKDFVNE